MPVLAPDGSGGRAFLPDPLPRDVTLSTATWTAVNEATAALARLDGAARQLPDASLLRHPAVRREAQSTSALEGTYAPLPEVLAADADDRAHLGSELFEVLNFEDVAELAFSWPEERRLTLAMLGELQRTLVQGTSGALPDAGGLRDRLVMIGARGARLDSARFVPPPPGDQLRSGVEALLDWFNDPPSLPTVVQAAMTHYQFESLHPYSDGNGRIGRLLVIVQLMRGAVIREPLLVVSPWFEARRPQYQDALLELSRSGDWSSWIGFFAEGIAASATESGQKVEALVALQQELRLRVREGGKRGATERLASDLIGLPYVDTTQVAERCNLSRQGAANTVRALVDLGILEAVGAVGRATLYRAPDVTRILED
ncbi:Fic/DOC family N-terminal domain-containing protein [Conexibacter stalactiti]|uniref:Fic family protein n=1 Tax=Conexibacter stalactiti TaxID=1940611 RepID=A0ABU4HY04_9ACTN|nr:Fic/DOC family N-terminal domain-containing protein [Conexibacter stalactiti]MDW5597749.1 Fic family protein [Conexibacter stalactiti]MEC5038391.1 Fic/DOC family N-terminal domain-containing protein [Conexibacter stalactiti]